MHADEYGLVTKYVDSHNVYRPFYSMFEKKSGLETFCISNHDISHGQFAIFLRRRTPVEASTNESPIALPLLQHRPQSLVEESETLYTDSVFWLFVCTFIYLCAFIVTQMFTSKPIALDTDMVFNHCRISRHSISILQILPMPSD
ncbi:unnamed protein product [Caenorhabditis bovis]|uniref:Uncharacterized protein n=1 Tax=Caenorhabditis bovis TaxID=2654633 RepID=A0A8S1EQS6_9PELO|nr:unnamed protein product [Caenorhabditis bovis]